MIKGKDIEVTFLENGKQRTLFKNLSFSFPDKGLIRIVGPSGIGKSTFLYLLSGLERPTSGSLFFKGKKYEKDFTYYRRKEFGFVFQNYELIPYLTVIENLEIFAKLKDVKLSNNLLKKVGLEGYENKKVTSLSGGEAQRVAIIRALIGNPSILLCDEPTGALDEENAKEVMRLLYEESKNKLVIIVTHQEHLLDSYHPLDFSFIDGVNSSSFSQIQKKTSAFSIPFFAYLSKKHFIKHKKRNLFSFFGFFISWTLTFFVLSFFLTAPKMIQEKEKQFYDYDTISISKIETTKIEGSHLQLTKMYRPNLQELEHLKNYFSFDMYYDLGAIISPTQTLYINDEEIPVRFLPDLSKNGKKGQYTINQTLAKRLKNQSFSISIKSYIPYQEETLFFSYQEEGSILKVVEECEFLKENTIYYDYFSYRKLLQDTSINGVNLYKMVEQSEPSSPVGNYKMLLKIHQNVSSCFAFFQSFSTWEISSQSYQIAKTFSSLLEVIQLSGSLYSSLCIIGSLFIFFLSLSSLLQDETPTLSLLSMFGATKKELGSSFALESSYLIFLSIFFSFLTFYIVRPFINSYLLETLGMAWIGPFSLRISLLFFLIPVIFFLFSYLFTQIQFQDGSLLEKRKAL